MAGVDPRKVALVTGASSGIGRATAEAFVARGYATALIDRDDDGGRVVEAQLRKSGECLFIRCDVTDDGAVRDAVARTVSAYGRPGCGLQCRRHRRRGRQAHRRLQHGELESRDRHRSHGPLVVHAL